MKFPPLNSEITSLHSSFLYHMFFGPSIMWFFCPSIIRFFYSSVLPSYGSSFLPPSIIRIFYSSVLQSYTVLLFFRPFTIYGSSILPSFHHTILLFFCPSIIYGYSILPSFQHTVVRFFRPFVPLVLPSYNMIFNLTEKIPYPLREGVKKTFFLSAALYRCFIQF